MPWTTRPSGSALDRRGAEWRRIRAAVLRRDRWVCQLCGAPATVAGHIQPRCTWPAGTPGVDALTNLRAECATCSLDGGRRLGWAASTATRRRRRSPWLLA